MISPYTGSARAHIHKKKKVWGKMKTDRKNINLLSIVVATSRNMT